MATTLRLEKFGEINFFAMKTGDSSLNCGVVIRIDCGIMYGLICIGAAQL